MKSKRQLDADIAAALANKRPATKRPRRSHASTVPPRRSSKERLVKLLMERTDEARDVARDVLLEHGVIKTGRIDSIRFIGDSFSGLVYQINVVMNEGGGLGESDPKRFWMVDPAGDPDMPDVGGHVDFISTDDYPPTGKTPFGPKQQLHPVGGFLKRTLPESVIRKWIQRWWPD